jgi:hypothetical protein
MAIPGHAEISSRAMRSSAMKISPPLGLIKKETASLKPFLSLNQIVVRFAEQFGEPIYVDIFINPSPIAFSGTKRALPSLESQHAQKVSGLEAIRAVGVWMYMEAVPDIALSPLKPGQRDERITGSCLSSDLAL